MDAQAAIDELCDLRVTTNRDTFGPVPLQQRRRVGMQHPERNKEVVRCTPFYLFPQTTFQTSSVYGCLILYKNPRFFHFFMFLGFYTFQQAHAYTLGQ